MTVFKAHLGKVCSIEEIEVTEATLSQVQLTDGRWIPTSGDNYRVLFNRPTAIGCVRGWLKGNIERGKKLVEDSEVALALFNKDYSD